MIKGEVLKGIRIKISNTCRHDLEDLKERISVWTNREVRILSYDHFIVEIKEKKEKHEEVFKILNENHVRYETISNT